MTRSFDYSLDFEHTNFRAHPELYRIGRGDQGVLLVEPYKSELLPLWKFRTPEVARESAEALYQRYLQYKVSNDFVGMDMARKFLQMGFTRSKHHASRPDSDNGDGQEDPLKAEAAKIFYEKYVQVRDDSDYQLLARLHRLRHEPPESGR